MITKEHVLRSLFVPLGAIYPLPALKDGQAATVAARCGRGITEEHLENLAVRIIETRRQKTFPSTQELIEHVKAIKPPGHSRTASSGDASDRPSFEGEAPMTWVADDEAIFATLAAMYERERQCPAKAHASKYADGQGFFFPTGMFDRVAQLSPPT